MFSASFYSIYFYIELYLLTSLKLHFSPHSHISFKYFADLTHYFALVTAYVASVSCIHGKGLGKLTPPSACKKKIIWYRSIDGLHKVDTFFLFII